MLTDLHSTQDSLSAALSKMKLQSFIAGAFDAGGAWAIEFGGYDILRYNYVAKGDCWLSVEGDKNKYHLEAGDCFLIKGGMSFVVAKDLKIKKRVKSETFAESMSKTGIAVCNGGGDTLVISAFFTLEGHFSNVIFGQLPPVIVIPGNLDQAGVLRWSLERFSSEFRGRSPGRSLMLSQLAPVMLLQTFRLYLTTAKNERNWLVALRDPKVSRAIDAMHADASRNWSLEELAKVAGMSRAGFALNFKKLVGVPPLDYLRSWRMQLARELLQQGQQSLLAIANWVGYESESAFSSAFMKIVKCRPGVFQKNYENPRAPR